MNFSPILRGLINLSAVEGVNVFTLRNKKKTFRGVTIPTLTPSPNAN